jgi:8-oxo-dGTP pyrophosphatase MutT (NUDIX family)
MRWQVHGTREIYSSPWVRLRVDDVTMASGVQVDHHVVEFPKPSVGAVVTDAEGRILLMWRHRHITDAAGWEIPAGWAEPGEDLAEAVRREVLEETGFEAGHAAELVVYHPLSGISTMTYTVFHATGVTEVGEPDADEADRVSWFTAAEARALLAKGLVPDGPSLTALSFYLATADL